MKPYKFLCLLSLLIAMLAACTKDVLPETDSDPGTVTRAYGDKTPKIMVYVETNDTNPLNAGDYYLADGKPVVDLVEFFASNVHKRTVNGVVEPTLYLNPELTRLLEPDPAAPDTTGYHKYVKRLQAKGIKVLVTVLGDWQGIGVANMDSEQTTKFAAILAHMVEKYELDGLGFSDHYGNYTYTVSTSYSQIITKLRALMPADKLITVMDWGYSNTLTPEAVACIDYMYNGYWGANTFLTSASVNIDKTRWAPMALNLGNSYSTLNLRMLLNNSKKAVSLDYGMICNFNLRRSSERNPLPVFEAYAAGAYNGTVSVEGGDRPQDWQFIYPGLTITYDDVKATEPENPVLPELDLNFPAIPTATHGSRTPLNLTTVYVDKTNPLNAGSYYLGNSTSDPAFVDLCVLDAVKIHTDAQGNPMLYLDQNMYPILSDVDTYVRPLQNKGIKVLARIVSDYQKIGLANMTPEQADRFADMLVWIVGHYGLNGVSLDDEHADYTSLISDSYANVILKLREKFDRVFPGEGRLITLKQMGNYGLITAEAGAAIDYAAHGSYSSINFLTSSSIAGMTNDRWAPMVVRVSIVPGAILTTLKSNSIRAKNGNYGMIATEDLRAADDVDPLMFFQKIAEGAFASTVTYDGNAYAKDWVATGSRTITYNDILQK